jgi:hypothetical protein
VSPTDKEPRPRDGVTTTMKSAFADRPLHALPAPGPLPSVYFGEVLDARRSSVAGPLSEQELGDLLFHTMRPRRGGNGRFGQPWEGRASPSAGGLHVISILCIPVESHASVGIYDCCRHGIRLIEAAHYLRKENAANVALLSSAQSGTTLQFMADATSLAACYENSETLLWRDSGALAATIGLVAACLGITSVVLGRTGESLPVLEGLDGMLAIGAVHLGAPI